MLPVSGSELLQVFTDGACSGNPGPGGWAWAVPDGPHGSGSEATSTNQRMELHAVLDALATLGPLHVGAIEVVSDSTYVVNCFRDGWWKGWLARGWKNSQKQPVANKDLWAPLIEHYRLRERTPGAVRFRWVKGHSGHPMNDRVDELAVVASHAQHGRLIVGLRDSAANVSPVSFQDDPAPGAKSDSGDQGHLF